MYSPREIFSNYGDKTNLSPLGNKTVGTQATNGTLHRRRNSTSIFTAASLSQIFQPTGGLCTTPPKMSGKKRADLTKTIKKVKCEVLDEISPLGDNECRAGSIVGAIIDDTNDAENCHSPIMERIIGPSRKELFANDDNPWQWREGNDKETVYITSQLHESPGYYLPLSDAFKDGSVSNRRHNGCVFEGWVRALLEQKLFVSRRNDSKRAFFSFFQ